MFRKYTSPRPSTGDKNGHWLLQHGVKSYRGKRKRRVLERERVKERLKENGKEFCGKGGNVTK
jgi:hypothetical protein